MKNNYTLHHIFHLLKLTNEYSGQWDGGKGQGDISYTDGKKYTGDWHWIVGDGYKRHGLGTLYSADGQVLNQGKWDKDQYKGKK